MPPSKSLEQKKTAARVQNLLKEYGDILIDTVEEINKALQVDITETSVGEIALEYKKRQGGRQALNNLLARLNAKANDRN